MIDLQEIFETQHMIDREHLDIRTITMGISLRDCADGDAKTAVGKIYEKITRCAEKLVSVGEDIEREMGIPIVNKRISVTPWRWLRTQATRRIMSPSRWRWIVRRTPAA